jgi:hypothetical protein
MSTMQNEAPSKRVLPGVVELAVMTKKTDYQFTSTLTDSHLHAVGAGVHSAENMRRFISDTHERVLANGCQAVLLESRFEGPSLDLASIYAIVLDKHLDGAALKRVAYVDTTAQHLPERAEFAELAANRLGVNARVMHTVAEAERWLIEQHRPGSRVDPM